MGYKGPFLVEYDGINPSSQRIEPIYSPGKTKFLNTAKNSSAKVFQPTAFDNITYNAVVIKVSRDWSLNPLSYLPFTDSGTTYTITARIPGLHAHLPDPFKHKNHAALIDLYPTFVGELKEEPSVGSIVSVAFLDNNDKMKKYGNGKILNVVHHSPVNGLFEDKNGSPAPPSAGSSYRNPAAPSLSNVACEFLDFDSPLPETQKAPPPNNKSRKEENPQKVGGSYRDRAATSATETARVARLRALVASQLDNELVLSDPLEGVKIASVEPLFQGARDLALMAIEYVSPSETLTKAAEVVLSPDQALLNAVAGDINRANPYARERFSKQIENDLSTGFAKSPASCKSIATVADYNAAIRSREEKPETAEYPRWPVTVGGYDVDTRQPTAGLWKGQGGSQNLLGGITSLMQAKRTVTAGGTTKTRNHCGIDIATAVGTPTLAVLEGEVVFAKNTSTGGGATIVIKHDVSGTPIWAGYCHMSAILCSKGQKLKKGECIGLTGGAKGAWGAGRSGGPHLHFQLCLKRRGNMVLSNYINPLKFFGTKIAGIPWLGGGS